MYKKFPEWGRTDTIYREVLCTDSFSGDFLPGISEVERGFGRDDLSERFICLLCAESEWAERRNKEAGKTE